MGRNSNSTPAAPSYKSGVIKYGDKVVGKTYYDSKTGSIVTQYLPDAAEEQRKSLIQTKINSILGTLGQTSAETATSYDNMKSSFVNDATATFNKAYTPALDSLRENIASRFGSLNNSEFFNNLNNLEKNRSSALAEIATKGESLKTDLYNQDENKKLSELSVLNGMLNNTQSNATQTASSSISASTVLNDFLNSQWLTDLKNFTTNQNSQKSLWSSLFKF